MYSINQIRQLQNSLKTKINQEDHELFLKIASYMPSPSKLNAASFLLRTPPEDVAKWIVENEAYRSN